jgi:hypothetical protein
MKGKITIIWIPKAKPEKIKVVRPKIKPRSVKI